MGDRSIPEEDILELVHASISEHECSVGAVDDSRGGSIYMSSGCEKLDKKISNLVARKNLPGLLVWHVMMLNDICKDNRI